MTRPLRYNALDTGLFSSRGYKSRNLLRFRSISKNYNNIPFPNSSRINRRSFLRWAGSFISMSWSVSSSILNRHWPSISSFLNAATCFVISIDTSHWPTSAMVQVSGLPEVTREKKEVRERNWNWHTRWQRRCDWRQWWSSRDWRIALHCLDFFRQSCNLLL